jgi:hypothetical protein
MRQLINTSPIRNQTPIFTILLVLLIYAIPQASHSNAAQLTPETAELLKRALSENPEAGIESIYDAMRHIPDRPDWQLVLDDLINQIRNNPNDDNNKRCLTIEHILRVHKEKAHIDIRPLIPVLKTDNPLNQQKAAQAIEAVINRNDIVKPLEKELIAALIPLTTSQRDRVIIPALKVLEYITGQKTIGRNPDAWNNYYYNRFHERLNLTKAVYEMLIIVNLPENAKPGFIYDGHLITDIKLLEKAFLAVKSQADNLKLQTSLIIITDQAFLASNDKMSKLLERITPLEPMMKNTGINSVTFAPRTEKYYPVWKPLND